MRPRARSSGDERATARSEPRHRRYENTAGEREVERTHPKILGGDIKGVTPDPIPNSEVKLLGADGTARAT